MGSHEEISLMQTVMPETTQYRLFSDKNEILGVSYQCFTLKSSLKYASHDA